MGAEAIARYEKVGQEAWRRGPECPLPAHSFGLDVVGGLAIDLDYACHCGAISVKLLDLAEQRVEFSWWEP